MRASLQGALVFHVDQQPFVSLFAVVGVGDPGRQEQSASAPSYLVFLRRPALIASAAVTAVEECTYPIVMGFIITVPVQI
jgi:hypothetical protein